MNLNETPSANRTHIGFFGRRNAGKSSLLNAVTGQNLAVVSEIKGTTTDPVSKTMELLPLGPVVIIDTPGIDDEGPLGGQRIRKTKQVLNKTDVAVLVVDSVSGKAPADKSLISLFREKEIPFIIAYNKCDLKPYAPANPQEIGVSAANGTGIQELKEKIAALAAGGAPPKPLVADLLSPGDFVVLVTPIDASAPKGRLILPQQQTIRDILDAGAVSIVTKEDGLRETLASLGKRPKLVITDSQVFAKAAAQTPPDIWLTSFSVLFARYKGLLEGAVRGAKALDSLKDGGQILISEGCTHHRQCEDIGTVKLPRWIEEYTGKNLDFRFTSGTEFPEDLSPFQLIVHCGGCMLNQREMAYRQKCAADQSIPMTNYGTAIAHMQNILARSTEMFF